MIGTIIGKVVALRSELTYHGKTDKFSVVGTAGQFSLEAINKILDGYIESNIPINKELAKKYGHGYSPMKIEQVKEEAIQEVFDLAKETKFSIKYQGYMSAQPPIQIHSGKWYCPGGASRLLRQLRNVA